jgi:hypothetical protein
VAVAIGKKGYFLNGDLVNTGLVSRRKPILRILSGIFLLPLALVCFSLSVPPADLPLLGIMILIGSKGLALSLRHNPKWRWFWSIALAMSVFGAALEIVASKRIASQRSQEENIAISTNK